MTLFRVAHLIETMNTGGAEAVVASLVDNLSPPFQPLLVILKETGTSADRIARKGSEIVELGKGEGNDPGVPFRLATLLKERNVSVLHTHNWSVFCEGMIAGILAGVPARVHTVHGNFRLYPPGLTSRLKQMGRHLVESLLTIPTGRIVAVSEDIRSVVCETLHVDPRKVLVINNGVDVPNNRVSPDFSLMKENAGGGVPTITSVGRLAEVKNVQMLLRAVSIVDVPFSFRLVIVGDGPERRKLEGLAHELGIRDKVVFLGNRSDVRELLEGSVLFALSSTYEGVSIAILEAMATGLPVVATRVGGNPGIVAEGQSGYLVDLNDSKAMAEKITALLRDRELRARMGGKGRRIVEERYTTARMARDYEKIYMDLLQTG